MAHARAIEIELFPTVGDDVAPAPFTVTGGSTLVTVWLEGRTRQAVAQGRYVDLVALPDAGYVPLGPSDLIDTVRAAADVDETIKQARSRRGNQDLTLHVTPAGRDVHAELGLRRPPRPEPPDVPGDPFGRDAGNPSR